MAKIDVKKRYSLIVTIVLFGVLMIAFMFIYKFSNASNSFLYVKVDNINPLVIDKAVKEPDKTNANITIANEIKRAYNLDVVYGTGTESMDKSVDAEAIYDPQKINNMFVDFTTCIEKYPQNIIREIQSKGYNVEVYFVNNFNNNDLALATRDVNNNFKIYISNLEAGSKSFEAVHHEMYHILEYYMKLQYNIDDLYKDWDNYNPSGFEYDSNVNNLNSKYVYGYNSSSTGAYFVSIYSKVSEKEDRAEVFAFTMVSTSEPGYYTDNLGAIKGKMELICNALRQTFACLKYEDNVEWEKYF
ncbi:MAG: hypothetical protein FWF46_05140 [Oscillospiraceae bacterium]|nr:hypothetical protein [Oscillospiraceae bacterium]